MEPLGPMNLTGESVLSEEEAAVASIRSAIKELHDSVQDQCKATLVKIAKIGQIFLFFLSFSPVLFYLKVSVFAVNQEPVVLPPSTAAAAAEPTLTGYSCQTTAQDTGLVTSLVQRCTE